MIDIVKDLEVALSKAQWLAIPPASLHREALAEILRLRQENAALRETVAAVSNSQLTITKPDQ